jgi:hypothetical protein
MVGFAILKSSSAAILMLDHRVDIFLKFRYPPYTVCRLMKQETQTKFSCQPAKMAKASRVAMTKLPFARPGEKPWVKIALIIAVALLVGFKLHQKFPLITYFKRH